MKKNIIFIAVCCLVQSQIVAWDWWWKKQKSLDEKQFDLQRKQINDPINPYVNYNAGVIAYKKQQYDVAAANFERALSYAPIQKNDFKLQAHFNAGQAFYKEALHRLGAEWEKKKHADEVYDKALQSTQAAIKQFEAVLVLDSQHEKAKTMKDEVERLQQKILAKKYQDKEEKKEDKKTDQSKQDKKNQEKQQREDSKQNQQGDGDQQEKQQGSEQQSDNNGQSGQASEQQGRNSNDSAKGKKDNQGTREQSGQNGEDESGEAKENKQQNSEQKTEQPDQKKQQGQGRDVHDSNEKSQQDAANKGRGAEGDQQEQDGNQAGMPEKKSGTEAGAAAALGNDVMEHVLDAHAKSVLEAVEQAEGNAQKRAMAYELMKMGRGMSGNSNQKPW